jgi:hypothetical protein
MVRTPSTGLARAFLLPLMLTIVPSSAFAALGGSVTSVDADRVHVQGALMRIVRTDAFALHEIRSASGTMIREYVNGSGTVFAVVWDGPWLPDLRQVLGEHFDRYQAAMRARQSARPARRGRDQRRRSRGPDERPSARVHGTGVCAALMPAGVHRVAAVAGR